MDPVEEGERHEAEVHLIAPFRCPQCQAEGFARAMEWASAICAEEGQAVRLCRETDPHEPDCARCAAMREEARRLDIQITSLGRAVRHRDALLESPWKGPRA